VAAQFLRSPAPFLHTNKCHKQSCMFPCDKKPVAHSFFKMVLWQARARPSTIFVDIHLSKQRRNVPCLSRVEIQRQKHGRGRVFDVLFLSLFSSLFCGRLFHLFLCIFSFCHTMRAPTHTCAGPSATHF